MTTKRMPVPPLIPQCPMCPICYKETDPHADGDFRCDTCKVWWNSANYDEFGTLDEDVEQCPAEDQPYADDASTPKIAHYRYRCFRTAGHPLGLFEHHVGYRCDDQPDYDGMPHEWDDEDGAS
jgi:hypothetical protein